MEHAGGRSGAAARKCVAHRRAAGAPGGAASRTVARAGENARCRSRVVRRRDHPSSLSALLREVFRGEFWRRTFTGVELLSKLPRGLAPLLRPGGRALSDGARSGTHLRLLPADPARVRADLPGRYRRVDAGGESAGRDLAIDFHARHAPLPPDAL